MALLIAFVTEREVLAALNVVQTLLLVVLTYERSHSYRNVRQARRNRRRIARRT